MTVVLNSCYSRDIDNLTNQSSSIQKTKFRALRVHKSLISKAVKRDLHRSLKQSAIDTTFNFKIEVIRNAIKKIANNELRDAEMSIIFCLQNEKINNLKALANTTDVLVSSCLEKYGIIPSTRFNNDSEETKVSVDTLDSIYAEAFFDEDIIDTKLERKKWAFKELNMSNVQLAYVREDFEMLREFSEMEIETAEDKFNLLQVGNTLKIRGYSKGAINAYVRAEHIYEAVDTAVLLNDWESAMKLAEEYNYVQVEAYLGEKAAKEISSGNLMTAARIYRKANKAQEASSILLRVGKQALKNNNFLKAKKLFVAAALEIEGTRIKTLNTEMRSISTQQVSKRHATTMLGSKSEKLSLKQRSISKAHTTLNTLVENDFSASENQDLDIPWKYAEAVHMLLLCHKQIYSGEFNQALQTALNLSCFENMLGKVNVYSTLAIAALYCEAWNIASNAFSELENNENNGIRSQQTCESPLQALLQESIAGTTSKYTEIAAILFTEYSPTSVENEVIGSERKTKHSFTCIATGQLIKKKDVGKESVKSCRRCLRKMLEDSIRWRQSCPLCHEILV